MTATIRPIGLLKTYVDNNAEVTVEAGRTVRQTLAELGIPPELVALVLVNETQQDKDYLLKEGDFIRVIAVIGGG